MKINFYAFVALAFFSPLCLGGSFSESDLVSKIDEMNSPQLLRVLSKQKGILFQQQSLENRLAPQLTQSLFYQDDKQDPFAGQLQQKNAYGLNLGVKGSTWLGARWDVGLALIESENQIQTLPSAAQKFDISVFTPSVGLDIDLWKNLLGHRDRNLYGLQNNQKKMSEIEMEIVKSQLISQIRKIYWDLSGVEFRREIIHHQIEKIDQQIVLIQERRDHGLADEDDLAGFLLQKENLNIQQLSLDQSKTQLVAQLQKFIPESDHLQSLKIQLQDISVVRREVMSCISIMSSFSKTPMHLTPYKEWIEKMNIQDQYQNTLDDEEGEADIHLSFQLQNPGFSTKHTSDAFSQSGTDKHKSSIRLTMAMPLGDSDLSKSYKKSSSKLQWRTSILEAEAKLQSLHEYTLSSLLQLQDVIKSTEKNRVYMDAIVAGSKIKYERGRIPLMTLLDQEKQSLSLDMNSVDTKIKVIHILLQYFSLFPGVECKFNKKVSL